MRVDGKPLGARRAHAALSVSQAAGLVTTARDPEGRPTVFDALPPDLPRLVAVGRLDINTEGLLLLTNDGGLARVLELPSTGWLRRYRVRAHGTIDQAALDRLSGGIAIDGVDYLGIEAKLDREQGDNVWITMGLREGKNREIKKVLEHLGLAVNRLIRISFGPFELGDLAEGEVAEVRTRVLARPTGREARQGGRRRFRRAARSIAPRRRRRRAAPSAERSAKSAGSASASPGAGDRAGGSDQGAAGTAAAQFERDEAPRRAPPPSTPERRRKHVSALRAEIAADAAGPRRRVERSATHDRKGRDDRRRAHFPGRRMRRGDAPPPKRARRARGAPRRQARRTGV